MAKPRLVIDDPAVYSPLPYGLLSVVQAPSPASPHWQNGVTYQAYCAAGGSTTYDECVSELADESPGEPGTLPEPPAKAADTAALLRAATPFTVYAEFGCSPVGNPDAAGVASAALDRAEPWQIERAFWTGVAGGQQVVYPHLAETLTASPPGEPDVVLQTAADNLGGPYDMAHGLGLLEGALADCSDMVGVVHVPRAALETLAAIGALKTAGGRLVTAGGNLVAAGAGYPGTSPAGAAPAAGTTWIYGTGPVFRFAGPVMLDTPRESIDRATNTIQMRAERTNVLGWGCCHIAALVLLGAPA